MRTPEAGVSPPHTRPGLPFSCGVCPGGRFSRWAPRAGALIPVSVSGFAGQACQVASEFLLLCGIDLGPVLLQTGWHACHLRRLETPPLGTGPAQLLPRPVCRVGSASLQCTPGPAQKGHSLPFPHLAL